MQTVVNHLHRVLTDRYACCHAAVMGNTQVHVGVDLYAPARVVLPRTPIEGVGADVTAVLVLEGRRYVVQEMRIIRQDNGEPITSELIRGIPVQGVVRHYVRDLIERRIDMPSTKGVTHYQGGPVTLTEEERSGLVAAGPTDETLLWVARIYILAELAGEPPAKTVRFGLGIPESTANSWIRRAKDRGILDG